LKKLFFFIFLFSRFVTNAQIKADDIYSPVTLSSARENFKQTLIDKTILQTFSLPVNEETKYKFESALWGVTQFFYTGSGVKKGFDKLFAVYSKLENNTRQSLLEAAYAVYPKEYEQLIKKLIIKEKNEKLFAMMAVYLLRINPSQNKNLQTLLKKNFKSYRTNDLLKETLSFLQNKSTHKKKPPSFANLFLHQQKHKNKVVYSFQRWDRDYTGIAIVQNADGSFVKDENGELKTFIQLARSASNLPYFITNGSTPQGIYSITGTDKSKNTFIGPTPNLQLVMPNEVTEFIFFHQRTDTSNYINDYKKLLPPSWQTYRPMYESFTAGKIGRTEIIAHGTTIDPYFFKGKPYYPISPTLGCLCAKEIWDEQSGRLKESDMLNLTNTFLSTPGTKGFLIVINLDDRQKALSKEEIKKLVADYENKNAPE
jgi:hypothetical protein